MKKLLLFLSVFFLVISGMAQTVVYHENFELPSTADSVVSSGNSPWAVSSHLQHSGLRSDTSKVAANDSSFLTTSAFSTSGNYYVILEFSHICKIEFFDNAIIQVSNNNGATWTQLTAAQYLGTGQFAANGNKFASTSYSDWLPAQPSAVPTNAWWKTEQFDISSLVSNASQVKVRFKLSDGNGTGAGSNYGWLIDDIKVTVNFSELNPPLITLLAPNYAGTVYSLGPFPVKAKITDVSGIDTAKVFYSINGGALNAVGMNVIGTDTFQGFIPAVNDLDTVCYYVYAEDASPSHNAAQAPASGCNSFVASAGITFPYFDNFDLSNNWFDTAVSVSSVWELGTPAYGATNSAHSAPNAWDVNLTTAYGSSAAAALFSPVFDFSAAVNAKMSFWMNYYTETSYDGTRLEYTTDGTTWQILGSIGDPNGVNWYTNTIYSSNQAAWAGNSGGWKKAEYTLTLLNNVVGPVQFRFVFTSDGSVQNDGFSIDDFSIALPAPQDAGVTNIIVPAMPGCISDNSPISVEIKNYGTQNIVGPFDVVYQIDNNTPVAEQYTGTIIPASADTMDFATAITATAGAHTIKVYTVLPGDGNLYNDTIASTFNIVFPFTIPYSNPLDSASDFADFCTTTGAYGTVQLLPDAANTGAAGMMMGVTAYTGWTTSVDTIPTSTYYLWDPTINPEQYSQARIVLNSTGYSSLVLKFDSKLLYLYGSLYTNLRVLVNGVQVSPYLCPSTASTPYITYEYDLSPFLPAPALTIDFESKDYYYYTYSPNGNTVYIDNVQIYEPPAQEAYLINMETPEGGCGLGLEAVSINIKNKGSDTISGGLNASYKITGSAGTVTETISSTILPGDTLLYTFTAPADLSVAGIDSIFEITSWVDLVGDPIQTNDTVHNNINSNYIPASPLVTDVSIPYGTSTTLNAVTSDSVRWFDVPVGGTALANSASFTTPILYDTTVFYVEAVAGSGIDSLSSTFAGGNGCGGGNMFDLLPVSSGLNISGFVIVPGTAGAQTVNVYYKTDTYFGYETSPSDWTLQGTYTVNAVAADAPTYLDVNDFQIPAGQTTAVYLNFDATYTSISAATTYSNATLQLTAGAGLCSFFGGVNANRAFNGTVYYGSGSGCASIRVPDTVFVTGIPACDVGVISVDAPVSGIEMGTSDTIIVKVKNYGTASQSNIPVHYTVNGGAAVNETIPGPISPEDTLVYTFTTTTDLSVFGTYEIEAYTSLACDNTHANDTSSAEVVNSPMVYCESGSYYPDSYEDIGNVTFSNINNGNALPATYNTTAVNGYTDFTGITPAYLSVGGNYPLSVSIISSSSFYDTYVKVFIDYNRNGMYDTIPETVFCGMATSASPTITGNVVIPVGAVTGEPIRMRVVAEEYGDSSSVWPCGLYYSYGETEDYFVYILPLIPHDAGVTEIIAPTPSENEGAVVPVEVVIKNYGTDTIFNSDNMQIAYSVNGGAPVSALYTGGPLYPSAIDTVTLSSITIAPGYNTICAYTVLANDSNTLNDQTCKDYYGNPLNDAGVIEILQPPVSVAAGSSQPVKVVFMNYGVNTVTSVNVAYTLNGGTPVTQTWTGSIATGEQDTLTLPSFTAPMNAFGICAYTMLTNDGDHTNDTLCTSSFGLSKVNLTYCDNFDDTSNVAWYQESLGSGTDWELGTPAYGVTDSSYSTPNAWDINLTAGYQSYAESYLYTQLFSFTNVTDAQMSFWQNRYTETSYDGVRIDYTTDGGSNWQVLGTTTSPNAANWYTNSSISSSSLPGWDGQTSGWIKSEYTLTELNNISDVQFRFVFTSDGSVEYDGFSLDNFCIEADTFTDVGISRIVLPSGTVTPIVPTTVQATIRNYGFTTLTTIPVRYVINGADSVSEVWTGSLVPGDSIDYTFTQTYTPPSMAFYSMCVKTTLDDSIYANNKKCSSFYTVGIEEVSGNNLYLGQNIPNPANNLTTIYYYLPEKGDAEFYVMNSIGQKLFLKEITAGEGEHSIVLDITDWNAGVYYYILEFNGEKLYRKMVITK